MNSYSQYGEDKIVSEYLAQNWDGCRQYVLDIGAWDPKTFSNSRALIEAGWRAVLVEPSPGPFKALRSEYYTDRWMSQVRLINKAVSIDGASAVDMWITDDAVSTTSEAVHETWKDAGGYKGKLTIETILLPDLLELGPYSVVSIDTEGTSVDVAIALINVCSVSMIPSLPIVLIVEHDGRLIELMQYAQLAGYKVIHVNGTNAILAK